MDRQHTPPSVLIIYYSLSGQSRGLVNLFAAGLRDEGVSVTVEKLKASERVVFPFKSTIHTIRMMVTTFFRLRIPIKPLNTICFSPYNLIVLAGPTWSYNPCGPILSLFDRDGTMLFAGKRVLPLISCRGYYRLHNYLLRRELLKMGAHLEESLILNHPVEEPWSTIGVFLKSSGYHPEKMDLLKNHYKHYGHTKDQLKKVREHGQDTAKRLLQLTVS